jgi:Na+:H+ antiporter, NhaA family
MIREDPPGAWVPARRLLGLARGPIERFLHIEAASGIVLLAAALVAMVWANSPARASYDALWHTPIGLRLGAWAFERSLHFWVNDGAMTIFFFVVGLEIRREIHRGELSELRRAALPLVAALGGMVAPAILYASLNHGRPSLVGWGVPMATDIAFAVGVLALLGRRVAPALRVLLLALAVIDDVGAIIVIALFYSASLDAGALVWVGSGVLAIVTLQLVGVRSPWAYVIPGVVLWAGTYAVGIHPTLAGVALGVMTPVRAWFGVRRSAELVHTNAEAVRGSPDDHSARPHLDAIDLARREALAPVDRLQHALHGWVAFLVMPIFALANAGVPLGDAAWSADAVRVFAGVTIGLVLGKPLGIVGLSWLMHRLGLVLLPAGVGWREVALVGCVAGIGFTMALFVAGLAFPPGPLLETAKLAIVTASVVAGAGSLVAGRFVLRRVSAHGAATATAAESSTVA